MFILWKTLKKSNVASQSSIQPIVLEIFAKKSISIQMTVTTDVGGVSNGFSGISDVHSIENFTPHTTVSVPDVCDVGKCRKSYVTGRKSK